MDTVIVYFSQTGNTKKVALAMADVFREQGHKVNVTSWKDVRLSDIAGCSVLGMGSPCFESQAPAPVKAFLKGLPLLKGKTAFVFATCGGAPGRILFDLSKGLKKKKARVIAGFMCHGEVHHPAPCLKGRLPGRPGEEDLTLARDFARAIVTNTAAGYTAPLSGEWSDLLKPGCSFYHLVSFIAKPPLVRILLPKPTLVASRCNMCGLCARECPAGCISSEEEPVPGSACIRCYRCLTVCPKTAFRVSWWYGNLVIWALYNKLFSRLFGDLKPDERIY